MAMFAQILNALQEVFPFAVIVTLTKEDLLKKLPA